MPDIKISSLEGQEFGAYCAMPVGAHGSGLIVIQNQWGVSASIRSLCDAYAAQGYIVLSPDLFWRQQPNIQLSGDAPEEHVRAEELVKGFDVEAGVRDLLSTLGHLRAMKGCSGKVGAVGYGLGGKMAYLMATRSDVDAAVSYYGAGIEKYLDEVYDIRMPLVVHIAGADKAMTPDLRARLLRVFTRNPVITPHVYEGVDASFSRKDSRSYNPQASDLADSRTTAFLAERLQS